MALTTGSSSGTQTTTDTPQATTTDNGLSGTPTSGVQPGTATSLLSSPAGNAAVGVPLGQTQLSTVSLNAPATAAVVVQPRVSKPHHVNWGLFSMSGILLVIAVGLFWWMSHAAQSEKNTTK
jgi:hypothetical protein